MSEVLGTIRRETRRAFASNKVLKDEDRNRRLAVNESSACRLPLIYANNDYLLTKDDAWTSFQIPQKRWGFLNRDERKQYFYDANTFFAKVFPNDKESSGKIIVTNRVHTADEWEDSVVEAYKKTASPAFAQYVAASKTQIERSEFFDREVYLFSRLGNRGDNAGWVGFLRQFLEFWATGADMDDHQPDLEEQEAWDVQSASMVDTLSSSWVEAQPATRRRVEWLIRHLDAAGLPTPEVAPADAAEWGAGELRTTLASYTQEVELGSSASGQDKFKCLKIDGPTGTSYAAYLPLSHIRPSIAYSMHWMHHASTLPFPVDIFTDFECIDPERAERDIERPATDAEAQEDEDREAGVRPDDIVLSQQQGLRQAKKDIRMNREPIVYWQSVFCVYDQDKDTLLSKVNRLIKHYRDIDFELVCPRDDQRELFYQSFPGSKLTMGDWLHRTKTQYLAAAMPWLTSTVGDTGSRRGLYQGYTIVKGQKGVPVFYDLQNVVDAEGKAPTEAVAGFPGSGKTVSRGLKTALEDALRGVTQIIWDPKGDFLSLVRWAKQMRLDPSKVKLIDLYNPNSSVSLDAIALAEVDPEKGIDERSSGAMNVLSALCREFTNAHQQGSRDARYLLRSAVDRVIDEADANGTVAKMELVLQTIELWGKKDFTTFPDDVPEERVSEWATLCIQMARQLRGVQKSTLGRFLFLDPESAGSMKITQGDMVIFVALKMQTTEPGEEPTDSTLVADVISGQMTDYIRSLLHILPDEVPKAAVFDEWHVIRRVGRAQSLLDWMKRMGRSKRCMVRQMSQSANDFDHGSLSTVWCAQVPDDDEAEAACDLLGIEASDMNKALLKSLGKGQFLFRDVHGRVAHVQVDIWDSWLLERFDTSPEAKVRLIAELQNEGIMAAA